MIKNVFPLLMFFLVLNFLTTNAQKIHLISDPNSITQVLSGKYITYQNHLYTRYTDFTGMSYLARLDGDKLSIIPNPEPTFGFAGSPIVYNDKLYIRYEGYLGYQLAEYDGNTYKLINNPDNGNGYMGRPVIYKDKLYVQYDSTSLSGSTQNVLAVFNGKKLTVLPNLPNVKNVFGIPAIYHDKLYSIYSTTDSKYNLVSYNGNHFSIITNPDDGSGIQSNLTGFDTISEVKPIIFQDKLIVAYENFNQQLQLAECNGNVLSLIPNPNTAGRMDYIFPVIYNNNLYVIYNDTAFYTNGRIDKLCKYDGLKLETFNPPDSGSIVPGVSSVIYNNQLYFIILLSNIDYGSKLAFIDDKVIYSIPNPTPDYEQYDLTLYTNNLYFGYETNSNLTNLAKYNGNHIIIIDNLDNGYGFNGGAIVYNDTLFFVYKDVNYNDHLAYYVQSAVLAINVINFMAVLNNNQAMLTWQTTGQSNTSSFYVQRSFNGKDFSTIEKIYATSNNALSENYTYIDASSGNLKAVKLFYRLQEINNDGSISYSDIKQVDFPNSILLFSISPNPTKDFINVLSLEDVLDAQIYISSVNGKLLYKTKRNFIGGQLVKIPTSIFSNQLLLINIKAGNTNYKFKIVKE